MINVIACLLFLFSCIGVFSSVIFISNKLRMAKRKKILKEECYCRLKIEVKTLRDEMDSARRVYHAVCDDIKELKKIQQSINKG